MAAESAAQANKVFIFLDNVYSKYKTQAKDQRVFDPANVCLLIVYIEWLESMRYLTGNMSGVQNENFEFSKLLKQKNTELQSLVNANDRNKNLYSSVISEIDRLHNDGVIKGGKDMNADEFLNSDFTKAEEELSTCIDPSFINTVSK